MLDSLEVYKQILGEKKVSVIEFLCAKCDKNGFVTLTVSEICVQLALSKPTVINTLKILKDKNIISRIKNGVYKFNRF